MSPSLEEAERHYLLNELLQGVSRSFFLTLRVLPRQLQQPIGTAYLLARAADTISDTAVVSADKRGVALCHFRDQLLADEPSLVTFEQLQAEFIGRLDHAAEKALLAKLPQLFELLAQQCAADQRLIRKVVLTLIAGMASDFEAFPLLTESAATAVALRDCEQLERYTYLVAGCVGEFWTAISSVHLDALREWDQALQMQRGIRFGQALQMTNILRDVPRDLRIGRCYLPQSWLDEAALTPELLMDARNSVLARPVLIKGIGTALDHYAAAEEYLTALPRRCIRLRLAALWPILIGLETLVRLSHQSQWLESRVICKVDRGWLYRMLLLSCSAVFSNTLLRWWFAYLRRRISLETG